jgi:hypothetical protein
MSRTSTLVLAAAVMALAGTASPAAAPVPADAGKSVTFPFPAKAPVVVQVHGLERTADRVKSFVTAALPDFAKKANTAIDEGLKQALEGRQLTAVPKDGRAFLVIHDLARVTEDDPAVSLILPVTDYAKFRETFLTAAERKTFEKGKEGVDTFKTTATGQEMTVYVVDLKEHVALSADKAVAESLTGKYTRATTATLGAELAASFQAADVGVYVNLEMINDLYGDQIRQAKGLVDFLLGQAALGGGMQGLDKKQLDAAKVLINGAFQGLEDARGAVVGVEFREAGVRLRAQGRFANDSKSGRFLKAERPTSMADLANLPAGLAMYSGSALGKLAVEVLRGLSEEFAAPEDDEKAAGEIKKRQEELAAAGPTGEFAAASIPATSLTVSTFQDPAKAAAAIVGLYKAVPAGGRVQTVVLKEKPAVKEKAHTHAGITFAEIGLTFDFEASVRDVPEAGKEAAMKMMKRLVGEKMHVFVGADGTRVLKVIAKDWAAAEKLLADYLGGKSGVGAAKGFRLTRSNLPAQANMLALAETGESIKTVVEMIKAIADAIPGFPAELGDLKPPKGEPTFLGVAVTLKAETASLDVFVPADAVAAAAKMFGPLLKSIE